MHTNVLNVNCSVSMQCDANYIEEGIYGYPVHFRFFSDSLRCFDLITSMSFHVILIFMKSPEIDNNKEKWLRSHDGELENVKISIFRDKLHSYLCPLH